ncbi:MAG: pyridoxal phosphate-dependent aminotransferase [Candidatus Kaiserbacteria bacterium]|nr:pyridoxal phosphate-dependent aminotransferase [Candidatus Kaiserbacteria bacterium]
MHERIASPAFFIGKGDETLISFGSGQPDLPPPPAAYKVLEHFKSFKYGLVQGEESLRSAIAKEYPFAEPEDFVITNGASEAIDLAMRAIAQDAPGSKVLLPRPYYYSYPHNVSLAWMIPVYTDLENGKLSFERFVRDVEGCRAMLINSPSNPTGTVQDIEVLKKIESYCEERGIYIVSDEVYKDLIYVRENYLLHGKRVITINSFSKTYAMCGLRVGYLYTKDREVIERAVEMKSHTSMNTSLVGQAMALAAMGERDAYVASHAKIWRERRDLMYRGMLDLGLDLWEPEGAFYVLPKFKNPERSMHDLYYNYKIITYNGEWFGAPDRLRFSYALDTDKIHEGLRRVKEFLGKEYATY